MVDSSGTFQLVTLAEAARVLTVSESTVRRLVKAGRLEAQRVERPQGYTYLVKVPAPATDQADQPPNQIAVEGSTLSQPPALAAWMSSVLEPLVTELSVSRQQLVAQAEQIGTLRAERDAARQALAAAARPESSPDGPGSTETDRTTTEPPGRLSALWLRWWLALAVLSACCVALAWLLTR